MVELEAGSPVGGSQQRLQSAGQVDEHVAHQEEPAGHRGTDTLHSDGDASTTPAPPPPLRCCCCCCSLEEEQHGKSCESSHGEDWGHGVQRGDEDAALADAGRQQEGPGGLSVGFAVAEDLRSRRRQAFGNVGTLALQRFTIVRLRFEFS